MVNPLATSGSTLVLNIESDCEVDTLLPKKALQAGLFSCVVGDAEDHPQHPVLREYRAQLKTRDT